MEKFFEKNIGALRKNNPGLAESLSAVPARADIKITISPAGLPVPSLSPEGREFFLHSRFDPVKEAERFAAEVKAADFDLIIISGFAYAYHVEAIAGAARPDSTIIVIEKDAGIIKSALENRDLRSLLSDERLIVLHEPSDSDFSANLKGRSSRKVSLVSHRGSIRLYPDYYKNTADIARTYISDKEVNIATLAKFEKIWGLNIARNAGGFIGMPGAEIFFEAFNGETVMLVSAGPSLTASLDFIRQNSRRALIVAVDTAYKILLSGGIVPHFCLAVDPQLINARYFEGVPETGCVLVADPVLHPSALRFFGGKRVFTGIAFEMMKWMEEIAGTRGHVEHGGSVSTNASDFAKKLGASKIYMLGQDLAFSGGLAHARGSYLDEQIFLRNSRFLTPLVFNMSQMRALPAIKVRGIRGGEVRTNRKMLVFLNWFSRRADDRLVNISADGASIPGLTHDLPGNCTFPAEEKDFFALIHGIYAQAFEKRAAAAHESAAALTAKADKVLSELSVLEEPLRRAVSLAENLLSIMRIQENKRDLSRVDYILKKLARTDEIVQSGISVAGIISISMQRTIHTIMEGYSIDGDDSDIPGGELVAKKSLFLYRGLLDAVMFNKKVFAKMAALAGRT